jgi:hypothetical protein
MQAKLNVTTKILAFADEQVSSNPRLRAPDWLRDISGISVSNFKTEGYTIQVGGTLNAFNGARATSVASDTVFSMALTSLDPSRYRLSWTGGTDPVFRNSRGVACSGVSMALTVNANATLTVVAGSAIFTSVQAGDSVYIPGVTTGESSGPFSPLNEGGWIVLSKSGSNSLTLVRAPGTDFVGVTETQTPSADSQFRVFSSAGVQVGDSVDISQGFSIGSLNTFDIVLVTDTFVDIESAIPLANETGITPGASGIQFFFSVKSFLYVEASQQVALRLNGDSGVTQRICPVPTDDGSLAPGNYMKRGPVWSIQIVNKCPSNVEVFLIHAE